MFKFIKQMKNNVLKQENTFTTLTATEHAEIVEKYFHVVNTTYDFQEFLKAYRNVLYHQEQLAIWWRSRGGDTEAEDNLKEMLHLAIIYPYLIPLLDEYVFVPYEAPIESIAQFANIIFSSSVIVENYEAMIYAIYFALKYNFDIKKLKVDWITTKDSCLLKCFSLLYYRKQNDLKSIKTLKSYARKLLDKQDNEEIDENWLFIYEALPKEQLKGEWKAMKKSNISFIKEEYRCQSDKL